MKPVNQFKHVLLIDDDNTTNLVNERLIWTNSCAGCVHAVNNSEEALKYLKENAENGQTPVDLILLDLKMDGHDGFWFLEQYKKRTNVQKAKLVVALTSSASFYDLQKLKKIPEVVCHMFKPLTIKHLADLADRMSVQVA